MKIILVTEGFVKTIGFHTSSLRLRGGETFRMYMYNICVWFRDLIFYES